MKRPTDLETLRKKIAAIDTKIMDLLDERLVLAEGIGAYKRENELAIEDPHLEMRKRRERAEYLRKHSKNHVRDVETIFRSIINVSRDVQRRGLLTRTTGGGKIRIAVMGSVGSFSEEAAHRYCAEHSIANPTILYPVSAEGVLHLLEVEQADIGIFPIHNSTGGIVEESIYAASEHTFFIDDIFGFEVRQCLLTLPGVSMKDITTIMSHPQALAQCTAYIKKNFPTATLIESSDTATAAKFLSGKNGKKNTAVIAPKSCAKLYKLKLLEEGIQDQKNNITHFIAAMM